MVDKSTKSGVTIFGMLIAAGVVLLALVLSADAQDFEPERRPEEGLFLSMPVNDGSFAPKSTSFTTNPNAGTSYAGTSVISSDGGYLSIPTYSLSGAAPYNYADRAEWRTRPLTMSLWYRNLFSVYQQNTRFFGNGGWSGSADIGYVNFMDTAFSGVPYNQFTVALGDGGNVTAYPGSTPSLGDGAWNHCAVVLDIGSARMYHNGALVSTMSGTFGTAATARTLYIGGANINSGGCDLDEIRIYAGKALSTAEIVSIYQSGRTGQGDNQP